MDKFKQFVYFFNNGKDLNSLVMLFRGFCSFDMINLKKKKKKKKKKKVMYVTTLGNLRYLVFKENFNYCYKNFRTELIKHEIKAPYPFS